MNKIFLTIISLLCLVYFSCAKHNNSPRKTTLRSAASYCEDHHQIQIRITIDDPQLTEIFFQQMDSLEVNNQLIDEDSLTKDIDQSKITIFMNEKYAEELKESSAVLRVSYTNHDGQMEELLIEPLELLKLKKNNASCQDSLASWHFYGKIPNQSIKAL